MTGRTSFGAPWSGLLKLTSALVAALLVAIGVSLQHTSHTYPSLQLDGLPIRWTAIAIWGVLLGSVLFTVRGYQLTPSELLVQRLLWATRIPLQDLRAAWADPAAMKWSLRLFGNSGLFGIIGVFKNRKLGRYRAYATEPKNSVVLEFAWRTVVITPDDPQEFLGTLAVHSPRASVGAAPR
jgi:hypothetical protein